jgi:hypothetical protein
MAHDVTFTIPERSLGKADVEFKVKRNGEAGGTLKVSNGSVVWVPAGKQYGYKLKWKEIDALAREHGKSERS